MNALMTIGTPRRTRAVIADGYRWTPELADIGTE